AVAVQGPSIMLGSTAAIAVQGLFGLRSCNNSARTLYSVYRLCSYSSNTETFIVSVGSLTASTVQEPLRGDLDLVTTTAV
ncbi:5128_t:CDS:1, partial [Ambispora leptoticha]